MANIAQNNTKIEDYRAGYPQYTALISAHDPFLLCRRFNRLRIRLLLLKQDKLSLLEHQLDELDRQETRPLFLGMSRSDANTDRIDLFAQVETALADYDQFAERTHRMLSMNVAQQRDVQSLQNWLDGTSCVARQETEYLEHESDLVTLAPPCDNALTQLEVWIEDMLIRFRRGFRQSRHLNISNDENVYIYSGSLIRRMARILLLVLITMLMLIPVMTCNLVAGFSERIVIVVMSTMCYLFVLAQLTKSRTIDLTLAGGTYVTVMIVFISGTSGLSD